MRSPLILSSAAKQPLAHAAALARLGALASCVVAGACVRPAQVWPTPLTPGRQMTAKFQWPRAIPVGNDSVLVVKELSGSVVALRGDTLVVRLTSVPESPTHAAWAGRNATIVLDSATTITRPEVDQSAVALMVVAGLAFFYAFIASLPP